MNADELDPRLGSPALRLDDRHVRTACSECVSNATRRINRPNLVTDRPDRKISVVVAGVVETSFTEGFDEATCLGLTGEVNRRVRGKPSVGTHLGSHRCNVALVARRGDVDLPSPASCLLDQGKYALVVGQMCRVNGRLGGDAVLQPGLPLQH